MFEYITQNYLVISSVFTGLLIYLASIIYLLRRVSSTLTREMEYSVSFKFSEQIERQNLALKSQLKTMQETNNALRLISNNIGNEVHTLLNQFEDDLIKSIDTTTYHFNLHTEAINSHIDDLVKRYDLLLRKDNTILSLQAEIEKNNAKDKRQHR